MDDINEGDWVAVAECGPLQVSAMESDGTVVVDDRGERLPLPPEEAERRIRPLVEVSTAADIRGEFADLGEPNQADRAYDRSKAYRAALRSNDLRNMAATLSGIYQHPEPDYPENQNVDRFEEAVFGEMARVLDEREPTLMREAREDCGVPFPVPDRSQAVADSEPIPHIDGYSRLGAFATEDRMIAGEAGTGEALEVEPGVWYAYAFKDEEAPPPIKLLCIHADAFDDLAVHGEQLRQRGAFPIEAASAALVDERMLDEPAFWSELAFAETETVGDRGVQLLLGGDGEGHIFASPDDDPFELVVLNLYTQGDAPDDDGAESDDD